jgi:hypothetical protein
MVLGCDDRIVDLGRRCRGTLALAGSSEWDAQGHINNGLGTTIRKADNPSWFRGLMLSTKAFSIWFWLFALFGFGATLTWIWRALV